MDLCSWDSFSLVSCALFLLRSIWRTSLITAHINVDYYCEIILITLISKQCYSINNLIRKWITNNRKMRRWWMIILVIMRYKRNIWSLEAAKFIAWRISHESPSNFHCCCCFSCIFSVPPHQILVYDASGRDVSGAIGPLYEGDNLVLSCEVRGGKSNK